jgi:hypothetical protein
MDRRLLDYSPESETFEAGAIAQSESEWPGGTSAEEEVFGELEEMELAANLLEVGSEAELDRFLGNLISRVGRAAGSVARSPTGQAVAGILKDAAKRALPTIGRAIEQRLDGAAGAGVSAQVVKAAGQYLGLELEGLSPEDQEFEAAKSFVRFAGEAAKNAVRAPAGIAPEAAVMQAARRYAPGLLRPGRLSNGPDPRSANPGARFIPAASGRWVRRGANIVVVDS